MVTNWIVLNFRTDEVVTKLKTIAKKTYCMFDFNILVNYPYTYDETNNQIFENLKIELPYSNNIDEVATLRSKA